MILTAPVAISGVVVPKWLPKNQIPSYLGVRKEWFNQELRIEQPFLQEIQQELERQFNVMREEQSIIEPQEDVLEEEEWDWEAMGKDSDIGVDSEVFDISGDDSS